MSRHSRRQSLAQGVARSAEPWDHAPNDIPKPALAGETSVAR